MAEYQEQIDRVKTQIADTTEKADVYLTQLTAKVEKYQKTHENMEPASEYLKKALDASRAATQNLKTHGQELSEKSVPAAVDGLESMRESLETLKTQAVAYDDKYASSKGQKAVKSLHGLVNAGRQHAMEALELTSEQLANLRQTLENVVGQAALGTQVVVGEVAMLAEKGDEKLDVSGKSTDVVQKVMALDERIGVSKTAAKVDEKVTGGLGSRMVSSTVEMAREGVEYILETLQRAKVTAQQAEASQKVEAKAAVATEAVAEKEMQIQETIVDACYDVEEVAEEAAAGAGKKVDQAKSMVAGEEEGAEATDESATDVVKDKLASTAKTAEKLTDSAREKAFSESEKLAEKAKEIKGTAQTESKQAKDVAEHELEQAKGSGQTKIEQLKEKTAEAKGVDQKKVEQAKSTYREMQHGKEKEKEHGAGKSTCAAGVGCGPDTKQTKGRGNASQKKRTRK